MSSYIYEAKNPKTGKTVKAYFIDNYYGSHRYGIGFKKDGSDASWEDDFDIYNCDFYEELPN